MTPKRIHASLYLTLLLPGACVEAKSLGMLDDADTTDGDTGEAGDDTTEGEPSTGEDPPDPGTTGVPGELPEGCPEGQATLSPLWTADIHAYMADWNGGGYWPPGPMVATDDGKVLIGVELGQGADNGAGLLVLGPDGGDLGRVFAPIDEVGKSVTAMTRTHAGEVLMLGVRYENDVKTARLERFGADQTPLGEVSLDLFAPWTGTHAVLMAMGADLPVIAGYDHPSGALHLASVDHLTGASAWSVELGDAPTNPVQGLAVGPAGEIAVATPVYGDDFTAEQLRLRAFTMDGAALWDRVLDVPAYQSITDLEFAADDRLLVLHGGSLGSDANVDLTAVDASDGAQLWHRRLATTVGETRPWARTLLVDGGVVTVPLAWTDRLQEGEPASGRTFSALRTTLGGDPLGEWPLAAAVGFGSGIVHAVRGACGELVLLVERDELPYALAFAP